ncbi:hypothetical protein ASA1KI_21620 [Opitutales bacterium ASA1]|uniref:ribonuclease H-like domain-containing protein n=1 Tax=Congregicoccus parvus TaxID=3081749 RepID=UPI002B2991A2|nr:hypothetical protein ASA1KI_21620 [Opitutales bacterium ASA1]
MKRNIHKSNGPLHVALDIETAPAQSYGELPDKIRDYVDRKIAKARITDPECEYSKFASTHPAFGRVVCITLGCVDELDGAPIIVTRTLSGAEGELLTAFNAALSRFSATFVHYNGLSFDAPFILTRMRLAGLECTIPGFADLRRFRSEPHCDLMEVLANWDRSRAISLEVAAFLAGLPTPKCDISGSQVATAFAAGQVDKISRYCERDVATTVNIHRKLVLFLPVVPTSRCFWKDDSGAMRPIDFGDVSKGRAESNVSALLCGKPSEVAAAPAVSPAAA